MSSGNEVRDGAVEVIATRCLTPRAGLDALVTALAAAGHRVVGPVVRAGVIDYADLVTGDDLPTGATVEQAPGRWRLHESDGPHRFDYTPGAASWKQFVHPAHEEVVRIRRVDGSFVAASPDAPARPLALIGARDCELNALAILDRVLLDDVHADPRYRSRRDGTFVVAVTCGVPSATCWCTSIGGGPQPRDRFDIRLTELDDDLGHRLLAEAATERGAEVLAALPADAVARPEVTSADHAAAASVVARATAAMPVRLSGTELPARLAGTDHDPHWDEVATRCLSCGNCTMVCPTCFCATFTDTTALGSDEVGRTREWASCFQLDHSVLGGRPVRDTTAARYRQWLTHKLQTWTDQFGTLGCVGCGRCTTWCPAGIDLVAEAVAVTAPADSRLEGKERP